MLPNRPDIDALILSIDLNPDNIDSLIHSGRKGMKWYQRIFTAGKELIKKRKRARAKAERERKKRKKERAEFEAKRKADQKSARIAKQKRRIETKNRRALSDEEIKKRVERLELEKKYKDLSDKDVNAARSYIKKILSSSGETYLRNASSGAMAYATKWAMTGEFNWKELAKYVAPNPHQKK